jgi:hypothetical protein
VTEERVACFSGREKAPFKSDSDSQPPCEAQSPTSYTQTSVHTSLTQGAPVFSSSFIVIIFFLAFVCWLPFVVLGLWPSARFRARRDNCARRSEEGRRGIEICAKKERGRS